MPSHKGGSCSFIPSSEEQLALEVKFSRLVGLRRELAETWLARLLKNLGLDAANTIVQFGPRPTSEL